MKIIKDFTLTLVVFLLSIVLYIEISNVWAEYGGIRSNITKMELPLLIILFLLLYFPTKNIIKNTLLITIPILSIYMLHDIFYSFLARSPRFSDFNNITMLNDFSILMHVGIVIIFLLLLLNFTYLIYLSKQAMSNITFYILIIIKSFLLLCLFLSFQTRYFDKFVLEKFDYYSWSQSRTIKKNGRISSVFYYTISSKQARKELTIYKDENIPINRLLFDKQTIKNKRNIYIVILESFIDPRLIKDTTFNKPPLYEKMKKYLQNSEFSYINASIYGGGTAQSEFEILTAIPALAKIDSIEFNTLEGHSISGFLNLLQQNGYTSDAIIASNSKYYNSKNAYKSIGFDRTLFLEEINNFKTIQGDTKIFDAELYNYSLNTLKEQDNVNSHLYYLLGMYGHFPYDRNLKLRPDIITSTHPDKKVHKIANQFYYRTKALANYISSIITIDPQAIIFVSSDHLPPILSNTIEYKKDKFQNIALLLVDGHPVNINGLSYYDIPRIIFKFLNQDSSPLKKIDSITYKKIYLKALSESLFSL